MILGSDSRTVRHEAMHDAVGYTPFEGMELRGWPDVVVARGEVLVAEGIDQTSQGRGRFVARSTPAGQPAI